MPIDNRELVAGRWKLSDFIYLEYLRGVGVFVDLGPFPDEPDDAKTDEAYEHLKSLEYDFLHLGMLEWSIDLALLTEAIPELKPENLTGELRHLPAFRVSGLFSAVRLLGGRLASEDKSCYLRIDFEFGATVEEPDMLKEDWQPPTIIS